MRRGSKQIGAFFERVRELSGFATMVEFADVLGLKDSSHLSRVESGDRLPGPELLGRLMPFIRKSGENPRALLYAWLEAQGLTDYVSAVKKGDS